MNRKRVALLLLVTLSVIAGTVAYVILRSSPEATVVVDDTKITTGEKIAIEGTVTCLLVKGNPNTVNTSCALGIKSDDGKSYALSIGDPALTASLPTGQKVQVSGNLVQRVTQYDTIGTIEVEEIKAL